MRTITRRRPTYDAVYHVTRVTDALNQATNHAYDPVGNRISTTDAVSQTTTYAYDALNRSGDDHQPRGQNPACDL